MMEWDEDGKIQDLDLSLPGKDALGWVNHINGKIINNE